MRNSDECRLLSKIDEVSFAMDDTRLYLDTHPHDCGAVAYFQKMQSLREKYIAEYTVKFGPINAYYVSKSNEWQWNECPYPWEVQ